MADWLILGSPWSTKANSAAETQVSSRPMLLVHEGVEKVRLAGADLSLPSAGHREFDGCRWRQFELPGTGRRSAGAEESELVLGNGLRSARLRFSGGLCPTQVRKEGHEDEGAEDSPGDRTQGFLGRHVELIYAPIEDQQRLYEGCAQIDLRDFLEGWKRSEEVQEAKLALIVHIARAIGRTVQSIGERPRRVLRRRREMERASAVRQIDPKGIRWLVRQPGRNLAERAGPRQRLLAVVREETVDTLENRVVRDLIDRSVLECRTWLRDNDEPQYRQSERYRDVKAYSGIVRRLTRAGPLAAVHAASDILHPNYVLQHDARYAPVWPWYVKLRRRQQEEDRLWRWSHRTFAEAVRLSLAWAMDNLEEDEAWPAGVGWARGLLLRPEQRYGAFLDPRSALAGWLVRIGQEVRCLSMLHGRQVGEFEQCFTTGSNLAELAPDAVVVLHDPFTRASKVKALAVWSRLCFDAAQTGVEDCRDLAASVASRRGKLEASAILVEPAQEGEKTSVGFEGRIPVKDGDPVNIQLMKAPLRLDRARAALQQTVSKYLLGRPVA